MNKIKEAPEMYLFSHGKEKCYGAIRNTTEMTEDIRFSTCSDLQFKVLEQVCDPISGEWIKNPVYENLSKDNLIYLCDDNKYFTFPDRKIRDDYAIATGSDIPSDHGRRVENHTHLSYDINDILTGFQVQEETTLRDISLEEGYDWKAFSTIDDFGLQEHPDNESGYYKRIACSSFIPITAYDVVSLGTRGGTYPFSSGYEIFFYADDTPNSLMAHMSVTSTKSYTGVSGHPYEYPQKLKRFNIESLTSSDFDNSINNFFGVDDSTAVSYALLNLKNLFRTNGGYIRIAATLDDVTDNNKVSYDETSGEAEYVFPTKNFIRIYSGQRFCSKIENIPSTASHSIPLHWFVITDTSDEFDGNTRIKTVSAKSYEYTISNNTISLSEDTLPFYVPPQIKEIITGSNWLIDKIRNSNPATNSVTVKGKQEIPDGLLNQILDLLPDWSIGHISSELMARYRKVSSVDNSNLYTFLTNDASSLYQCIFVFDSDQKTISAYTQEDAIKDTGIVLNWQNALDSLTVSNQNTNSVTALRIHTSDDTYGVGLVNPVGNSVIYNFNDILDKLDFVADTSTDDPLHRNQIQEEGEYVGFRTLKQAVVELMDFSENPKLTITEKICNTIGDGDALDFQKDTNTYTNKKITISGIESFREIAKDFVDSNMSKIKAESVLKTAKTDYETILSKIAVQAEYYNSDHNTDIDYFRQEVVQTPTYLKGYQPAGGAAKDRVFGTKELYNELCEAAKKYHIARANLDATTTDYNAYYDVLSTVAKKTSLNYYSQLKATQNYNGVSSDNSLSILTPKEILVLQPYIREGDWTNSNSTFSENYDAKDIINTLVEVYNQAKTDMDTFISKTNYDFEAGVINWLTIPEMQRSFNALKMGNTIRINTLKSTYVSPILLELHIDYLNKDNFTMQFSTDYTRQVLEYRFADLFNTISQVSVTSNTFNFAE